MSLAELLARQARRRRLARLSAVCAACVLVLAVPYLVTSAAMGVG